MTTGIIIGGFVALLILFTIFRYRRRSDAMPKQFHESIPIEILYTGIPVLMVAFLFLFTVLTENNVDATVPVNARVTTTGTPVGDVKVTAFQWGWRFDYPGHNVEIAGDVTNGPGNHGPQMVLPFGQTVQVTLVSNDVIHGFYVRDFNFSRYALPGVVNIFDLNILRPGIYPGQCTQICGLYHTEMLFSVRAVSPGPSSSRGLRRGGRRPHPPADPRAGHQQAAALCPRDTSNALAAPCFEEGFPVTTTIESPDLIQPEEPDGPDGHGPGTTATTAATSTTARPASSTG